jgi:hypothetical protein
MLRLLVTVLVVMCGFYLIYTSSRTPGLPFNLTVADAGTAVISPLGGVPLPAGVQAGDRVDLAALDLTARVAANQSAVLMSGTQPLGQRYDFVLLRDGAQLTVPVEAIEIGSNRGSAWVAWLTRCLSFLTGFIGLLVVWRGRDWAAAGLAVWALTQLAANAAGHLPVTGTLALLAVLVPGLMFLCARVGFYVMAEVMIGSGLAPRARMAFRAAFVFLLLLGALHRPGAALIYVATGWAGLLGPGYGLLLTLSYFPPVVMVAAAYRYADPDQRLRLRWMLWGSGAYLCGILIVDTSAVGAIFSLIFGFCLYVFAMLSILYAVLRHRVVKVSVAINRTLVYGGVTALVVGIVAAVNSLVLRFALPPGAGLLLQVVVPLSLGIALSKLRTLMDTVVEQVFFRGRYLTEQALRGFARRAGHIDRAQDLVEATVREVSRHLGVSAVAVYSAEEQGFHLMRQAGDGGYPVELGNNDDAVLAIRAEGRATDLERLASALGTQSCVVPMLVLGNLRGLLVVKDRPGEHFGSDELALLAEVAQEVGAAWRILRARDNEALVAAMAAGSVAPDAAFAQARRLSLAWAGS